jgi:hypothetical protein
MVPQAAVAFQIGGKLKPIRKGSGAAVEVVDSRWLPASDHRDCGPSPSSQVELPGRDLIREQRQLFGIAPPLLIADPLRGVSASNQPFWAG